MKRLSFVIAILVLVTFSCETGNFEEINENVEVEGASKGGGSLTPPGVSVSKTPYSLTFELSESLVLNPQEYIIQLSLDGSSTWQTVSLDFPENTYTFSQLTPSTTYYYRVRLRYGTEYSNWVPHYPETGTLYNTVTTSPYDGRFDNASPCDNDFIAWNEVVAAYGHTNIFYQFHATNVDLSHLDTDKLCLEVARYRRNTTTPLLYEGCLTEANGLRFLTIQKGDHWDWPGYYNDVKARFIYDGVEYPWSDLVRIPDWDVRSYVRPMSDFCD